MREPGKIARSYALLKTSIQALGGNKTLLLFPLASALFIALIVAFFVGIGVFRDPENMPAGRGMFAIIYLASMFFSTFLNVAFAHEVMKALNGEPVSVRAGFAFAVHRIQSILMWSLFAGVVGLAISTLEQRFGLFGKIVLRTTGVVWSVASVFAIPVMIREESINPIGLLRKSYGTLRKAWGEMLIGYVGLGLVGLLSGLVVGIIIVAGTFLALAVGSPWNVVLAGIGLLMVTFCVCVASSVDQLYRCALYIYASEGAAPAPYTTEMLDTAWKVKK